MNRKNFLTGIFLAVAAHIFSLPLTSLVESETATALLSGEQRNAIQDETSITALMPKSSYLHLLVSGMIDSLNPSLLAETLRLYRKPLSFRHPWTEAERAELYNKTLTLSALAGIQCFSTSRGRMRTFYESSSVVSGPDGKVCLPDPSLSSPSAQYTLYARQKDFTFGDNIYKYDYYLRDDLMLFVQENLTTMYYGIIPVVRKNNLRSVIAIIDSGDYLLVYAVAMAKAMNAHGTKARISTSLLARIDTVYGCFIDTVYGWFAERAEEVFSR